MRNVEKLKIEREKCIKIEIKEKKGKKKNEN